MRDHGTHACYVWGPNPGAGDGCRCEPCRQANRDYEAARARRVEPSYVSAESTREHIAWLASNGVGLKTVAARSGVSHGALWKIVYGVPSTGRPPTRRVRPATRDAILAIKPADGADGSRIPAAPVWADVATLLERGWTKKAIAQAIGQTGSGLQLGARFTTRCNARAVHALLDQPVPPRRSRHGLHPVPQPVELDHEAQLRIEARRENDRERQARYRAARNETTVDDLPRLDLALTLTNPQCRRPEVPAWLMFPDPDDTETIERAKAVCATCRNTEVCLRWALAHDEHGIWGGTTEADREAMRRQQAAS